MIEIKLSDEIKICLSRDWHLINNENKVRFHSRLRSGNMLQMNVDLFQLLRIPCQPTVEEIVHQYRQSKSSKPKSTEA